MTERHIRGMLFASALVATAVIGTEARAQVVQGIARISHTLLPIERAMVSARDKDGAVLGSAVTDRIGMFEFPVRAEVPFTLEVRRLGYQAGRAQVKALLPADTVSFEFLMVEVAAVSEAVVVTGEAGLNDRRLEEANRRGWRVYEPEVVMMHRERAQDFHQLLRSLGNPGLILPRNANDCVRASRNNRCLTVVVDNQVWGTSAIILPNDIYFLAVLSASESRSQFGERAPYGAIAVYTRSRLDRVQPRESPRRSTTRRPPGAN